MVTNISGVILAGGANKRFGGITKANAVIEGVSIISRIISKISDLFPEIIIVTNNPDDFVEFSLYKITGDLYQNTGPLGGIHAALKSASGDAIFVIASDMPFPDKNIINQQIKAFNNGQFDVLIPQLGQFIEPLHALYSKSILTDLERFLSERKSRAVRDFLKEIRTGYLQIPDTEQNKRAFTNINSPSDLDNIII